MAGIVDPINDLLAKIETGSIKFARVYNNQFQQMEEGTVESFPMPCAFVEVVSPNNYDQLGLGYTISDLVFRVHIGAVEYDSQSGTLEQNLSIFALRDEVISLLTYYELTRCSGLMKIAEQQDYTHTNVYHYIIDFTCSYFDEVGRTNKALIEKEPPTDLTVNAAFDLTYLHKK